MPSNLRGFGAASSPYLKKALDFNKLSTAPDTWRTGSDGRLHQLQGPNDTTENAPLVGVGEPLKENFWKELLHAAPYIGGAELMGVAGAMGPLAAGGHSAATGASEFGLASTPAAVGSAAPGAATATGAASVGAGGGSSMAGSSLLKGLIPDGKTLLLSLLSMFGSNQERKSFEGAGMADPKQALQQSINSIYRLGQGVTEMGPVKLRSSYVQAPPAPVTIPGLPFQIGGGMGRDPALADPSLMEGQGNPFKYDPFQSLSQAGANGNTNGNTATPGAKRRMP